ncbi:hypothetical protein OUZ56_021363 [Daphnia magna]|uniref:Uncharacterized protein n=1 Tax=Daphnia magna TaxID=35525 RepID=A0ABQ9ZH79_9CRUS|nr:hypothetical protein OUZ56_021363 [Daphnia magna]
MGHVGIGIIHAYAINLYFVYNINISLKSVFEIHGANLPHYHCQLTPLVGHDFPFPYQSGIRYSTNEIGYVNQLFFPTLSFAVAEPTHRQTETA